MKNFRLRLTGRRKCYFLVFAFFIFPYFKWLVSKWISRVLMKFYYITNIFDLQIFDNETAVLLFYFLFFWNLHGNAFCFFIISKWKKYYNLPFDDTFKCTVLHYANLNSSSINKPFLNYGPLSMLFRFFRFLIYLYFKDAFVKNFMKKLSFFNTNFHNSCQDVLYYGILGCQTLWC